MKKISRTIRNFFRRPLAAGILGLICLVFALGSIIWYMLGVNAATVSWPLILLTLICFLLLYLGDFNIGLDSTHIGVFLSISLSWIVAAPLAILAKSSILELSKQANTIVNISFLQVYLPILQFILFGLLFVQSLTPIRYWISRRRRKEN